MRKQEAGESFVNNRDTESLTSLTSLIGVAIRGHRPQRNAAVLRRAQSAGLRFFLAAGVCGGRRPARTLASGQKLGFAPGARRPSKPTENIEKQDISTCLGCAPGRELWCAGSRPEVRTLAASMRWHEVSFKRVAFVFGAVLAGRDAADRMIAASIAAFAFTNRANSPP